MTTNGAVTDFLGQTTVGQQGQGAQTSNLGTLTQQGFLDVLVRSLPEIVKIVQSVVTGQNVGGQSLGGQSLGGQSAVGHVGQQQGQAGVGQLDQQGFFDILVKTLPVIINAAQTIFSGQSVGGQSLGGQSLGGQQSQQQGQAGVGQLDQQGFFDILVKALPVVISAAQTIFSGQSVGGQSLGGQSLGGQSAVGQVGQQQGQAGQLDAQFLQFILPFIPALINIASSVIGELTKQSVGAQSLVGPSMFPSTPRPYSPWPAAASTM